MSATPHLLHLFSTFVAAGPQVRTAALIRALGGDFRHTIVPLDGNRGCAARLDGLPNVQYLQPPPKSRFVAGPRRMARLIRSVQPDAVLTYNWGAIEGVAGARLAGVRVLHAEDGFGPDEVRVQKLRRVLARRVVLRFAHRVVVPSNNLHKIARQAWKVPSERLVHVPNGIDLVEFSPETENRPEGSIDAKRVWGLTPDTIVLGTVAQLRPEKGLDLAMRAFAGFRREWSGKCALLIAGEGPITQPLLELADELGIGDGVVFAGPVEEAVSIYRALDVFLLTSYTEQMPLTLTEAMACGLPAVCTQVGDVADMVAESNRPFVIPSRDPDAFVEAALTLASDGELRKRVGADNRLKCEERFGEAAMIERYREIYEELVSGS